MKKQINCQYGDCLEIILNYLRNKTHIRPILIGIDGRSGSGKTTLANNIKTLNPEISIITGDDFYQHLSDQAGCPVPCAAALVLVPLGYGAWVC